MAGAVRAKKWAAPRAVLATASATSLAFGEDHPTPCYGEYWASALSAEHLIETFRTYYGPVHKAFEALDADGQDAFAKDLEELIHAWNASRDETVVIPSDYLEVVAVRR